MTLDGRDRRVVELVARFNQLSSSHIQKLIFTDVASNTPCDRVLKRLAERGYLARIERRNVGGSRGGSGQYVYQLGRHGHTLYKQNRYIPARSINYHSLTIADAYVYITLAERRGAVSVRGISTEPDCWVKIGAHELKPDLYVELERPTSGQRIKLWLEIDMGTEGQRQIKDKLNRYWEAFNAADTAEWPVYPLVVFVAIDEARARELHWLLEQGNKEAQGLFRVLPIDKFSTAFL